MVRRGQGRYVERKIQCIKCDKPFIVKTRWSLVCKECKEKGLENKVIEHKGKYNYKLIRQERLNKLNNLKKIIKNEIN